MSAEAFEVRRKALLRRLDEPGLSAQDVAVIFLSLKRLDVDRAAVAAQAELARIGRSDT